jgi:hypothetical protein
MFLVAAFGLVMILAVLATAGVSIGVPGLATVAFLLVPRLWRYRKPALAGMAGSLLGAVICGLLLGVPFLAGAGDKSPDESPLDAVLGVCTVAGLFVGLPAMSFLGYMAGFIRTLRRLPPEAS